MCCAKQRIKFYINIEVDLREYNNFMTFGNCIKLFFFQLVFTTFQLKLVFESFIVLQYYERCLLEVNARLNTYNDEFSK